MSNDSHQTRRFTAPSKPALVCGFIILAIALAGSVGNNTDSTPDDAYTGHSAIIDDTEEKFTGTKTETKTEPIKYESSTVDDSSLDEGKTEIRTKGVNGSKSVTYTVTYENGKEISREKVSEEITKEPVNEVKAVGTNKYHYVCANGTKYDNEAAKDECDRRVVWEKNRDKALAECNADNSKTSCWYDAYPGTTLHWSAYTQPSNTSTPNNGSTPSNTGAPSNGRTGAICKDGSRSSATGRGACSHHGGVARWLY